MLDSAGFDLWADGYDKAVGLSEEKNTYPFAGYKDVLGDIFQKVMTKKNARVLDIGFGTGTLTTKLYDNGCEIYGQDFSHRMIELAQAKMPNAHLYYGDFTKGLVQELRDQRFDFIIGTYSLHHVPYDQKTAFLQGLLNQLNDGGRILIGDVAFETKDDMNRCAEIAGDEWDADEFYFVAEDLKKEFPQATFICKSVCAGIIEIARNA